MSRVIPTSCIPYYIIKFKVIFCVRGVVSPILANVYLHYVLDLWFEKRVKCYCRGKAYLSRYADDFICAFEYKEDADRFYEVLPKRLNKFGLEIAEDKTKILTFSRNNSKGNGRFDYLGFEFELKKSRKDTLYVSRQTSKKKLRTALKNFKTWCKDNRDLRLRKMFNLLNRKLKGYYNYYGVIGNSKGISKFFYESIRILHKWLNRRSQRRSFNWVTFKKILNFYGIERPKITEKSEKQLKFSFA